MLARKVTLNPTPYDEGECFDGKVTLIFYKRIRLELIVYLLRLYVFFIICRFVRHAPERTQEDLAVAIRRFNVERNFSRVLHISL